MNEVTIKASKAKVKLIVASSVFIVLLGLLIAFGIIAIPVNLFYFIPMDSPWFGIGVVLLGLIFIIMAYEALNNNHLITINELGIDYKAFGSAFGLIPWEEIIDYKIIPVAQSRLLIIVVNDPQKYIDRMNPGINKLMAKTNTSSHGSPIALNIDVLECNPEDILQILDLHLAHGSKSISQL